MRSEIQDRPRLRWLAWLALAALAGMSAGCRTTHEEPIAIDEAMHDADYARRLGHRLEILNTRSEERNGRLFVQFQWHNRTWTDVRAQWTVEWFDAQGFLVEQVTDWRNLHLEGDAKEYVTITAPHPSAVTWKPKVRATPKIR